jgi:hypothetical protein
MSQTIWTQCEGASSLGLYEGAAWRVVQSQQLVGTRKLVDSDDEHELLEELIDQHKPAQPRGPGFGGLHYLFATTFRYPPLRYGSRFGTRAEPSIWYGAETLPTALAEVAYYRLLFLAGTAAPLTPLMVELCAFQAVLRSDRAVDLTAGRFSAHAQEISSPVRYDLAQALGRAMRADGVALFRYRSARDPQRGVNVGAFSPGVFRRKEPCNFKIWNCVVVRDAVEFSRKDFLEKGRYRFERADFLVDGQLPSPAV